MPVHAVGGSVRERHALRRCTRLCRQSRRDSACFSPARPFRIVAWGCCCWHLRCFPTPHSTAPDLDELWSLVDYFTWGSLLGTRRTFNREIADRIVAGRDKYASADDVRRGEEAAADLMSRLRPHLLRREKEVLRAMAVAHADVENLSEGLTRMRIGQPTKTLTFQAMGRKKEVVLWCTMPSPQVSPRVRHFSLSRRDRLVSLCMQIAAYKAFLESDRVAAVLRNSNRSALTAITVLRKISCHPVLLTAAEAACTADVVEPDELMDDECCSVPLAAAPWTKEALPAPDDLVTACGKLNVLIRLLILLRSEGHKILVFSQSNRMLDVIERVLCSLPSSCEAARGQEPLRSLRIDGTVPGADRSRIVHAFNADPRYSVCLLTTGVGSLGLTLTSATRVIIYDLSWNPAVDRQAIDRAYRMGQTLDVVSYRLISCGSIDEAMYRQQLFKGGAWLVRHL